MKSNVRWVVSTMLFIIVLSVCSAVSLHASTFTVTNTLDQGDGSLAWAITEAENHAGPDTIAFAIPKTDAGFVSHKGYWKIGILTPLPYLTQGGTFIDGSTQATNIENANPDGKEIVIRAESAYPVDLAGLFIQSAGNKIFDLCIGGFRGPAIKITTANAFENVVQNCYIGIDEDGNLSFNVKKSQGLNITDGAHHNLIGGGGADKRNIISGNYYEAIEMKAGHHNKILGNYIGVTRTGVNPMGNGWGEYPRQDYSVPLTGRYQAVYISEASYSNRIGGSQPGEGNIICASGRPGLRIDGVGSDSNLVKGNYIGIAADGETELGNGEAGIWISRGPAYNVIGGTEDGARNVVSGNHSSGIQMRQASHDNKVIGNYIGTNATATRLIPNSHNGMFFFGQPSEGFPNHNEIGPNNIIIASAAEKDNERYPLTWAAVRLDSGGTAFNKIFSNYLGTNPAGTLGSAWNSAVVIGGGAHDNTVGPDNVIGNVKKYGVWIRQKNTIRNPITKNRIVNCGKMPILLQDGGNNMIEQPVILTADEQGLTGVTIPGGVVEIFQGNSQAEQYLATVTADNQGNFSWQGSLSPDAFVTATVTDADANTSMLADNKAVPVELSSFIAEIISVDAVRLQWQTETETNNLGFYVERKGRADAFRSIAFIKGNGTSNNPHKYEYIDHQPGQSQVTYRLRQMDTDGKFSYSVEQNISLDTPTSFYLHQAFPNPFNAETILQFSLPNKGHTVLQIFNIHGQMIRTLKKGDLEKGAYSILWDGKDDSHQLVPSGQYFVRLVSGDQAQVRKIIMLR